MHIQVCLNDSTAIISREVTLLTSLVRLQDQTPEAALSRLHLYFGDDAEELAKGRVRFLK